VATLYSFVSYYLSDKQHGIQTAHVVGEFAKKYHGTDLDIDGLYTSWLYLSPTIVVLNGGDQRRLEEIKDSFAVSENQYPWAYFEESERSLNGALTSVSIILPEMFRDNYDRKQIMNGFKSDNIFDIAVAGLLYNSRLA
jgi:hypothetical protein